ncbi:MAG: hypothetical protein ACE5KH_04960 [Candidatus Geothermarchaeales archaeon]
MNPIHTESNLKQIVKYAKEVGPRNASLIARYTGIPHTTVRYSLRNLLKRGVRFRINVAYPRLGLRRHLLSFTFDESYTQPEEALQAMAGTAFLEWYGKALPSEDYFALVAVPPEFDHRYREFLEGLVQSKVLKKYDWHTMDWFRLRSVDENNYSFQQREWKVDWQTVDQRQVRVEEPRSEDRIELRADRTDILILKELQLDATRRLSKIARKLNLTYRTVYYHYTEHVVGQGLINKYTVYPDVAYPSNGGITLLHLFGGLDTDGLVVAENAFHQLPFTWMDGYGEEEGLYVVLTPLPSAELRDTLVSIARKIRGFRTKFSYTLLDSKERRYYTLPYEMMTEDSEWTFEPELAVRTVVAERPLQIMKK